MVTMAADFPYTVVAHVQQDSLPEEYRPEAEDSDTEDEPPQYGIR